MQCPHYSFFENAGVLKILTLVRVSSNRPLMKQQSHHVRILPILGNMYMKISTLFNIYTMVNLR